MRKMLGLPVACIGMAAVAAVLAPAASAAPVDAHATAINKFLAQNPQIKVVDKNFDPSTAVILGGPESANALTTESSSAASPNAMAAAASSCSQTNRASFITTSYQESLEGCSVIGWDKTARIPYTWQAWSQGTNSGPACVQGRGYSTNASVSTPVWGNAGCGGTGSADLYLGNRATTKKIRGKVMAVSTVAYVNWS